jgi:hypothetical protein
MTPEQLARQRIDDLLEEAGWVIQDASQADIAAGLGVALPRNTGCRLTPVPEARHLRTPTWSEENPTGRWRAYDYDQLVNRDKASLDIVRLRDEWLDDADKLPEPGIIAAEIVQDLEAALLQFREIAADLGEPENVLR